MEARISGAGGRGKGIEDICQQRLAKDYSREPPVMLPISVQMLTVTHVEVLQGVRDMEGSPSSERVAAARSDNDRESVRDGLGVDAKWQHQPVCEGALECESV